MDAIVRIHENVVRVKVGVTDPGRMKSGNGRPDPVPDGGGQDIQLPGKGARTGNPDRQQCSSVRQ
jgi:hypothetical protein